MASKPGALSVNGDSALAILIVAGSAVVGREAPAQAISQNYVGDEA